MKLRTVALALCVLGVSCGGGGAQASSTRTELVIAAASDLRPVFEELKAVFEQQYAAEVRFSFGSSGQLAQQIQAGAPFDLFASADVALVDDIVAAGKGDAATRAIYAIGHLGIWRKIGGATTIESLAGPTIRTVAIANPAHAPYGRAAMQSLASAELEASVGPKLVLGESVSDALRLATSGNADAAIVSVSLLAGRADGSWSLIPDALHAPIRQALVVTATTSAKSTASKAFAALVLSKRGQESLQRAGFTSAVDA